MSALLRAPLASVHGRRLAALLAVVVIAAALRLLDLEHAQHRHDDETMVYLASKAVSEWRPPVAGPESSFGVPHGPTAVALLMVPAALGGAELDALRSVALANVLAVALLFAALRRSFGADVAIVASLLFATNSWFVLYSRRAWPNAALPLFSILFFWALLRLVQSASPADPREPIRDGGEVRRATALAALALAVLVQAHLSAAAHLYTGLAAFALVGLWRHRDAWRAALCVFGLVVAPYALLVVAPRLPRVIVDRLAEATERPTGWPIAVADLERVRAFLELLTSHGYQAYATQAVRVVDARGAAFVLADAALLVAFCTGAGAVAWRAWRSTGRRRHTDLLLLIFVAAPVLFPAPAPHLGASHGLYPFYFLVAAPALFALAGEGFAALSAVCSRAGSTAGAVCRALAPGVAVAHLAAAGAFFVTIGEYRPDSDYGMPLAETRRFADVLEHQAAGSPILISGHDDVSEVAFRMLQHRGLRVAYVDDRSVLPLVDERALWVTTSDAGWTHRALRDRIGAREPATFTAAGGRWLARLFPLDGRELTSSASHAFRPPPSQALGSLGVIEGVKLEPRSSRQGGASVEVRWRLLRAPPELAIAQIAARVDRGIVVLAEEAIQPADARPEDARTLTRVVLLQRFRLVLPATLANGAFPLGIRLVSRWGRRPLTDLVTLGTLEIE